MIMLQNMQEIIRIIDKNIDKIPEQDYIDICNYLEDIYNNFNDDYDDSHNFDINYFAIENEKCKMFINLFCLTFVINMLAYISYV